jgi:hypothetical protein
LTLARPQFELAISFRTSTVDNVGLALLVAKRLERSLDFLENIVAPAPYFSQK